MNIIFLLITCLLPQTNFCFENINGLFEEINRKTVTYNAIAANIAWKSSISTDNSELIRDSVEYQKKRIIWQQNTCSKLATLHSRQLLNSTQRRQTYLLCRGPNFTFEEARYVSALYKDLQLTYSNVKICIPSEKNISKTNETEVQNAILEYLYAIEEIINEELEPINFASKLAVHDKGLEEHGLCIDGETEFERFMNNIKNEKVLRWFWMTWREKVGPPMKEPYKDLVVIENRAARRNGYADIGAAWRDELEIPNLKKICRQLYYEIKPFYELLHGFVRFHLKRYYGALVPEKGTIPAHLLGNLWSQSWDSLIDIITTNTVDLDDSIKKQNWTVFHMVKRAEDFYQSLGLPSMTDTFWRESVFAKESNGTRCHGAAADMFQNGDFRLIYCSGVSMQDFYVLHHEMGHIQYFMAYENQPGLFRQANTALHESIGDAIMFGVMTPQHLHRLGLLNDSVLYNNDLNVDYKTTEEKRSISYKKNNYIPSLNNVNGRNEKNKHVRNLNTVHERNQNIFDETNELFKSADLIIMLKQALNKIPQIPFSLILDEYRWKYFEGGISREHVNKEFWDLVEELSGISPPNDRNEYYFDVGAKFHVPDNTPYIRYFLSSFIQHQIFEALCKVAVFGRRDINAEIPDTITLNRCDIYGSKAAGKILKDIMSKGNSEHWKDILQATTGDENISASSLLRYYRPLYKILENYIRKYQVPIGW